MSYSYDRQASSRTAAFLLTKVVVDVDVNLYPEKLSWTPKGSILAVGRASFVLPHREHQGQPYELELSEDGTVLRCSCPDPMQEQLIHMAAKARKRELAELIEDEKHRGNLRKKS